jgi:hypothetical protein
MGWQFKDFDGRCEAVSGGPLWGNQFAAPLWEQPMCAEEQSNMHAETQELFWNYKELHRVYRRETSRALWALGNLHGEPIR